MVKVLRGSKKVCISRLELPIYLIAAYMEIVFVAEEK